VIASGHLEKMRVRPDGDGRASYALRLNGGEKGDGEPVDVPLDDAIGSPLRLAFDGAIHCIHCGRSTKKSFSQGYCYPCFKRLAQCDSCVMAPEKCHYEQGTCREPEWGEAHCMQPHVVYLANTTGPKVGLTRRGQMPTRWLDQGATQALPFARTATRQQAGFVEDLLRGSVTDRTQWQRLLKGDPEPLDLAALRGELARTHEDGLEALRERFGVQSLVLADEAEPFRFSYPVLAYPSKVTALNPERTPVIEGRLMGIKGQYLILDRGVLNVRKYTAWSAEVRVG
jgi:hypothetical protein